ncbi:MAG: hypothetical protein H6713_33930 [Myxococcales bacterium]|nr:hypothetical protein [Myxococcales bacterium]
MSEGDDASPAWVAPGLLHPLALTAVAVLLVNDHVLKARWPGLVSGKLSDVAGLVYFPLLLQAIVEAPRWARARYRPSPAILLVCVLITGLVFALVNLWAPATSLYERGFGAVRWCLLDGGWRTGGAPRPVTLTPDPTDLLALPSLWLAWRLGRAPDERARRRCGPARSSSAIRSPP